MAVLVAGTVLYRPARKVTTHRRSRSFKAVALLFIAAFDKASAIEIFTDRIAWERAAGAVITETFSTESTGNLDILALDSGLVSKVIGTKHANFVNAALEFNGGVSSVGTLRWMFPHSVSAFGGDFRSVDTDLSVAGEFDGAGETFVNVAAELGARSGFFGLVGQSRFTTIE